MKSKKVIIVTICIILVIILTGTLIVPAIITKQKAKEKYYEHESYHIKNPAVLYSEEEFHRLVKSKDDYLWELNKYDIELDEDDLEEIKEKDYSNFNYILVFVPTNSCGERIKFEEIDIDKKDKEATLEFTAHETCGVCAIEYELYEVSVPKYVDHSYDIDTDWDIEEANCDPYIAYKPILYLYPQEKTNIIVNFANEDNLTTTYPKFNKEWNVTVSPNGDIYDKEGNYYYALYWEEKDYSKVDFTEGFYVSKENEINFLEEKLTFLGLNNKEKNEFIMYWLPILEKNEHNLVYFELTDELQKQNKLSINPQPDTLIRIRMHVKKVNNKTNIKEQQLTKQERIGYTAIEWGGVIHN